MNSKKDILPIVIAAVIALLITGIVRWLLPLSSQNGKQEVSKNEISMPEIPLMVKAEKKKIIEKHVLITSKDIKKDEKIRADYFTWKKWPEDAMQSYFIAKDDNGTPLNNGADYSNALAMWAKADIPNGIPLTMAMLNSEDPSKKAEDEKKRKEEEEKKKLEKEKSESFIKKGMRAVTFSIDQKSASSSNMLEPGDLIDVLIMEQRADKIKMHKYRALKIIAIDGVTKFESAKRKGEHGNLFDTMNVGVSSFLSPKNVTLEVREELVEPMLKQSNTNGVILCIRSQSEPIDNNFEVDEEKSSEENSNTILDGILSINKSNPTDALLEEKARKEAEERSMSILMNNISMVNSAENMTGIKNAEQNNDSEKSDTTKGKKELSKDGKYYIVSGKVVGENPKEDPKTVVVYRKLTPTSVKFDETGKILDGNADGGSGSSGGMGNSSRSSFGKNGF